MEWSGYKGWMLRKEPIKALHTGGEYKKRVYRAISISAKCHADLKLTAAGGKKKKKKNVKLLSQAFF